MQKKEIKERDLESVEAACRILSHSLQCPDRSMVQEFMDKANELTGQTLSNWPYLLTEFVVCSSSWGVGVLIGRYMKYTAFPDMDHGEVSHLMEKLFIPISLMLAFLFNEESRRYTDNYQNWQNCIGALRDHVLYVHYRLKQSNKNMEDLTDFVAVASLLLTSLKIHGIRKAQEEHTLARYLVSCLGFFARFGRKPKKVPIYTAAVNMPKLWKLNMDAYNSFLPPEKFRSQALNSGAYRDFDNGIIKDAFRTLNMITCPTCPSPLYKLLWFLSVFLSAALVWDASNNITDEVIQSFGILFVLYAPYVFSMAGGVRSYHLSSGNIFWKAYAGGMKRLLTSTHELIHDDLDDLQDTQTPHSITTQTLLINKK